MKEKEGQGEQCSVERDVAMQTKVKVGDVEASTDQDAEKGHM